MPDLGWRVHSIAMQLAYNAYNASDSVQVRCPPLRPLRPLTSLSQNFHAVLFLEPDTMRPRAPLQHVLNTQSSHAADETGWGSKYDATDETVAAREARWVMTSCAHEVAFKAGKGKWGGTGKKIGPAAPNARASR